MILSGSASQTLAARLADELDESLGATTTKRFPDDELHVTVTEPIDERAIIVASTVSSDAHIELLQLQDAARQAGADEVVTVLPYMGYARQDQTFEPGEIISTRAAARAISTGTDRVLTVTPHEKNVASFFDVPTTVIDGAPRLADPLPAALTDPLFLSTDAAAAPLAESVRDAYGAGDCDHLIDATDGERPAPTEESLAGRDVVVVDDIVGTGSTMSGSVAVVADAEADRIFATCVHPVFATGALSKIARVGAELIYGTDTLERVISDVSVAPAIADAL
ncbi:ribose-phosphate diphosphokinase [Halorhabdus sp. BNX81]|uniref:ribose-phosphate diphosphokinase n=1 Tax=Halorhabdus sp. BNX81 TaxID=2980181 RepID=UPI0023DD49E7|nr:ribose-phosphate diphosphokinase [Halorhabdus sp. BNX81]WEL20161.1 Ribose-phosphate pyrophosphokinase [Halorhabdus sp. BNX81]